LPNRRHISVDRCHRPQDDHGAGRAWHHATPLPRHRCHKVPQHCSKVPTFGSHHRSAQSEFWCRRRRARYCAMTRIADSSGMIGLCGFSATRCRWAGEHSREPTCVGHIDRSRLPRR
jgi:hypothetical protein